MHPAVNKKCQAAYAGVQYFCRYWFKVFYNTTIAGIKSGTLICSLHKYNLTII